MLEVGRVALQFLRRPMQPSIRIETPSGSPSYVAFDMDAFEIEAAVELRGNSTGARLGWTQLQTVDMDRATYKGLTPDMGRVEVCRDRSKWAPAPICRDVSFPNDVFTALPGTQKGLGYTPQRPLNVALTPSSSPGTVRVSHADKPAQWYLASYDNERSKHPNYLAFAHVEMHFCAALLLQHQDGRLEQLKHFYWSVKWEDQFELIKHDRTVRIRPISGKADNKIVFKPFVNGPVSDGHLAALIAAPVGQTCNKRAELRNNHPEVHQFMHW